MATFTPRPPSRKARLSLTAKEYTKITHTIASVRRSRVPTEHDHIDEESDDYIEEEPSFLAEKSFVKAPLNSRLGLVPPPTPRNKGKEKATGDIGELSVELQEALILEDLLNVLTGIEGTHITFDEDYVPDEADEITLIRGPKYSVESTLNSSLRDLVERILPLATYYMSVRTFIELRSSLEFGLVNHSLCAGLRDMLKDYQTLMAQIEHAFNTSPEFSLQKLWFYVHPTLHTLSLLHKLVLALSPSIATTEDSSEEDNSDSNGSDDEAAKRRRAALGLAPLPPSLRKAPSPNSSQPPSSSYSEFPIIGGEVLTILSSLRQLHSGDPDATAVYSTLWRRSGIPYARMLNMWVRRGIWKDRWEEGCIRETKWSGIAAGGDEEWERRYTLRDGTSLTNSKSDRMSSALPNQAPVGVPAPRPYLTPMQANSTELRLPGGACIPQELEQWKFKILLAGKYLNVIRACGLDVSEDEDSHASPKTFGSWTEEVELGSDTWRRQIEEAYTCANVTLLELLIGEKDPRQAADNMVAAPVIRPYPQSIPASGKDTPLPSAPPYSQRENTLILRLRSLRHFFFLSQGSYLSHFLELAAVELRKSTKSVGVTRLQPLIDIALAAEGAPYREDVRVFVGNSGSLYDWLLKIVSVQGIAAAEQLEEEEKEKKEKDKEDGKKEKPILAIDALCLDYVVPFPLSLVISRSTLMRYQIIFRFLLHLKHIERTLSLMWMDQKQHIWRCPLPTHEDLDKWRKSLFILRTRMLVFVQQILSFAALDVLEPNWKKFEDRLRGVRTVDDLLRDHVDFLDTCLKGCMLTSSKLLKTYSRLIITCSTFAMYSSQFTTSAAAAVSQLDDPEGAASPKEMAKRWDFLNKFQQHFDHWLTNFADIVQFFASSENVALLPLATRLSQAQLLNRKEQSHDN